MLLSKYTSQSPEQAQGKPVTSATDVYIFGLILYKILTDRTPFEGDTFEVAIHHIQTAPTPPSSLNPNIPPVLDEIVLKCLEKLPEMRYQSISELAQAIDHIP